MTTESIAKVIDSINDGTGNDLIFQRPLMANVKLATVWLEYPKGDSADEKAHTFYLVYSDDETCIAAIYVMGANDLHVFVKEDYREQGVMTQALSDIVLPHLFCIDRKEQKATFNSKESQGLLKNVGFIILDRKNAVIRKEQVKHVDFPDLKPIPFPEERMKVLKKRVRIATGLLRMVNDEISLYSCGTLSEDIMDLVLDVDEIAYRVDDEWGKGRS